MEGVAYPHEPVTLRYGVAILRGRQAFWLIVGLFLLPLALVAIWIATLVWNTSGETSVVALLLEAVRSTAGDDPGLRFQLWLVIALLPVLAGVILFQRTGWLRIGNGGLEGYVPRFLGLGLTGQTVGRWRIAWDEIRAVRLLAPGGGGDGKLERRFAKAQRIGRYRLEIETARRTVRLSPFPWYRPGAADHRLGIRELSVLDAADAASYVERAPLVRSLAARAIPIDQSGGDPIDVAVTPSFNLAKHRGMVAQLAILFALGLYALIDTFFLSRYTPLDAVPRWPFALTLTAAIPLSALLGRGAPRAERLLVGALAVSALAAAVYPGLLRYNAATAERQVVDYVPVAPGRLRPATGDYPPIDLSGENLAEYWAHHGGDAIHRFTLLYGDAGFHQLDLAPFYERTRNFYREHRQ